jgi:transcriptional regulator with XRE-family HTH domain
MKLDGNLIRSRRVNLGLTQAGLAKKAGWDTRTIQRAEAGTPVSAVTAAAIAQLLEIRVDKLRAQVDPSLPHISEQLAGIVTLVPCQSGRLLYTQLTTTEFLTVEKDFEPRAEHRAAITRFGRLVDQTWSHPMCNPEGRVLQTRGEEAAFELMIEAGEVIEELEKLNLRILTGSYDLLHERIYYGEFGDAYIKTGSYKDTRYPALILCVTDRDDPWLRRSPDDHADAEIPF